MPRATCSVLGALIALIAALATAPARAGGTCLDVDAGDHRAAVEAADIIIVAVVVEAAPARAVLRPEAYLKGPATRGDIELRIPDPRPRCPLAGFEADTRVLAYLVEGGGRLQWPGAAEVYVFRQGIATNVGPVALALPEGTLVEQIRSLTGQYAVPAAADDDGAGIGWWKTVVPVGAALLVVFAVGLLLMRTWHRIDPS